MKTTIGTLFSGGGIGLARLKDICDIAFAVEYDAKIADVYKANISDRVSVGRVQDMNPSNFEPVDVLQVSPVCKEFSAAKTGGKESEEEISQAAAVCNFIQTLKPKFFILENVRGYVHSQSFQMICSTLLSQGYWLDLQAQMNLFDGCYKFSNLPVLNSANFRVPQTRERLILRASKDGPVPSLPKATRWTGWYEAIADLIPNLPESEFADWQLKRLPENFNFNSLVDGTGATISEQNDPASTVTTSFHNKTAMPKAFSYSGRQRFE